MMSNSHLFFFSSRRRHTRWPRDWSSDVCSSDLDLGTDQLRAYPLDEGMPEDEPVLTALPAGFGPRHLAMTGDHRSEERRVGKEICSRWLTEDRCKANAHASTDGVQTKIGRQTKD